MNSAAYAKQTSTVAFGVGLAGVLGISAVDLLLQLIEADVSLRDFPPLVIGKLGNCKILGKKEDHQRVISFSFGEGTPKAELIQLRYDYVDEGYEMRTIKHCGANGEAREAFKSLADSTGVTMHFCW